MCLSEKKQTVIHIRYARAYSYMHFARGRNRG